MDFVSCTNKNCGKFVTLTLSNPKAMSVVGRIDDSSFLVIAISEVELVLICDSSIHRFQYYTFLEKFYFKQDIFSKISILNP